jgi:hypothetical protein
VVILCFFGDPKPGQALGYLRGEVRPENCSDRARLGQPARELWNRSYLNSPMLRTNWLPFVAKLRSAPALLVLCSLAFLLNGAVPVFGQDFTLSASPFSPYAIDQGGSTLSNVTLSPLNGFSGTVSLGCTVTGGTPSTAPVCQVSPTSVTPPASASLTFSGTVAPPATGNANPGSYIVTVTGISGSLTHQQALNISVLAVAPSYTVTVQQPTVPSSVHAGAGATAILNINASNNYHMSGTGNDGETLGVWLSCATISPLVTYPPVCSFNPQPAPVTGPLTVVKLTITTFGNAQTAHNETPRGKFYALWLPLPMFAFVGIGAASSKRSRKTWLLLGLIILAGSLILTLGCGNTTTGITAPPIGNPTPKNTYTFTVMGVDGNGLISTNSGTSAPTVTLTVN